MAIEHPERSLGQRPEIELAWRRAAMSGLDPGMDVRERTIEDIDTRSSLLRAAAPVLDKLVDELSDTRFSVLLADRTSKIVDRRVGNRAVGRALDRVLAVPGFQYLEETSGTNSLATAFELRKPIAVTGEEHFLEALKYFACYGAPIIHPITHRVEGVLDVSGPVSDATGLLGPFLMRATRDIEQRLLEGSRVAEKLLLAEFQTHSSRRSHAVLALGENLVLTNVAAVDLVKGVDHASLRAIASDLAPGSPYEGPLVLASGRVVAVRACAVAGSNGGALFDLVERSPDASTFDLGAIATKSPDANMASRSPMSGIVLVTGEPGTGRTTTARTLVGSEAVSLDCAESVGAENEWFTEVRRALGSGVKALIIENIDALHPRSATALTQALESRRMPLVMTSIPVADLDRAHSALASLASSRHELQPLRSCPHKLPSLVQALMVQLRPDSGVEVAPSAVTSLAQYDWPGNVRELQDTLIYALQKRPNGVVTEEDLPEPIRQRPHVGRTLTVMETAERDAISGALRESRGNKASAAAMLGISRTTLYSRLQRYRIKVPSR
ncbi:helix-turn-helix domain-containing protein [Rhodococcus sp. (in: high G+C Gram-positive bacteria)]|uniref:sigma-54-dependent Fis family transcriptional regulator n=1 Tax=unclassified Rhodococcus (in: high G+C Gram-positive bacteria) TaxID=192944 RepID=UPI002AD8F48D|nr:helix-turn-helix domain-containing protein [Rhodococcus sp. (in: high G+C Gram-positive bacteria)]MDZ7931421.1 helix-turn-helix domain-containing protein [Rhodococcus sp. (in: high G+C Gram-positive bacteria)]